MDKAQQIESIISRDIGDRGIGKIATFYRGGLHEAIASIVSLNSPSIAILTGFYIPFCDQPAAETDGPIGAAFMYHALQELGIPVVVITDHLCANVVKGAIQSLPNVKEGNILVAKDLSGKWEADFWNEVNASVETNVTHLISIERPGRAKNDKYYNMLGRDLSDYIEPLDLLLPFCLSKKVKVISIGDGGNEAGMGVIDQNLIKKHVPNGGVIQSVISCDYIIVTGVSNWGGFAVSALLIHYFKKNISALLNAELHHNILRIIVEKNHAIDGVIKERIFKVDGLDELIHEKIISDIVAVF